MIRRPTSTPGRIHPEASRLIPVVVLLLAIAAAGCASSTATGVPSQSAPRSSAGPPTATSAPASDAPATTAAPVASPSESPATGATPSPAGSAAPSAPASTQAPDSGNASAAVCSGSPENRSFYASMAAAVAWPVYCPILADGWFVQSGQYRLAGGGQLQIEYQGPNRAQITLDQGAFCAIQGGCVPPGVDVGPTAFGDRDGTLVALDDGSWAVAADREGTPSWLLIVTGLDEAATRAIAARLAVVRG